MDCCYVDNCKGQTYITGLCSKHYNRLRTTGAFEDGPKARLPFIQRLWKYIDKRGADDCWPWIAKSKVDGYGTISLGGRHGKKVLAHRAVWEQENGPIPRNGEYHGTVIMHTCDNRACCNHAHLQAGTQRDNVEDMDDKNRRVSNPPTGESHHNSRFTAEDVLYIRSSGKTNAQIGREFECHRSTISDIRRRKTWSHVK